MPQPTTASALITPRSLVGGIQLLNKPDKPLSKRPTIHGIAEHTFSLSTLDFAFGIEKEGFVHDIITHLPITRLLRIHQLQKLTWLRISDTYEHLAGPHTFGHNRLVHSIWSGAARAIQNEALGITGPDALVGILVEVIHDLFTSAGGDIMKVINPSLFDEDHLIAELFTSREYREGWLRLQTKYSLPATTPERLYDALQGKGLDGELHETCDTWSYLANDLDSVIRAFGRFHLPIAPYLGTTIGTSGNRALQIFRHLAIEDGRAYVTDPDILADFLRLRVELWRQIYCHPGNKSIELFYRRIMLPHFFKKRKINPRQLLLWDDDTLAKTMRETLEFPNMHTVNVEDSWPTIEYFSQWDAAQEAEERARHRGKLTLLASLKGDQPVKPKTGKYLVRSANGTIQPFNVAYPDKAAPIEALAATPVCERIQLIAYPRAKDFFSKPIIESWKEARKGWDTEPEYGVNP